MRTEAEVESFKAEASEVVRDCKSCNNSFTNVECDCVRTYLFEVEAYEACLPRDFWYIQTKDVTVNASVFEEYIKKYVKKLSIAHKNGYGLLLTGSNGVGKSTFLSYIGANAIRQGKSVYYTTMPQLDYDMKLGFEDNKAKSRLEVMLTSDFLILDEMNKEVFKDLEKPTWFKTQVERLLKRRFDECKPVLMASNARLSVISATYGPTVASMISGKYQVVLMEPGDARPKLSLKMKKDMNFEE